MKPVLVLCGILTVMATTLAQETATLEIPEPGDGGPSLRVLGDAVLNSRLSVANGLNVTEGKIIINGETTAAALIQSERMIERLVGLKVTSNNINDFGYSSTGIRSEAQGKSTNYGIWTTASGGTENWAGWFEGDVKVNNELHVSKLARLERGLLIEENGGITVEGQGIPLDNNANSYSGAVFDISAPTLGVYGIQTKANAGAGSGTGIKAVGTGSGGGWGVEAVGKGRGKNIGIWATAENGTENWAGWFEGDVKTTGLASFDSKIRADGAAALNGGLTITGQGGNLEPDNEKASFGGLVDITTSNDFVEGIRVSSINEGKGRTVGISATAVSNAAADVYDTPETFGVYASAHGEGTNYGVKASASGGEENYAGWFDGDVVINGKLKIDDWTISQVSDGVPDYVFKEDYKLRTLQEVEEYVTEKSHLPEVPSAQEIKKNGIDLAEMNMVLLKKVEELTLYTIQQQKQIDELKAKIDR